MENYGRYKDLEHLLFKGFIPHKIKIGDVNIVLKSINETELEEINLKSGLDKGHQYLFNIHINYIFYSIYMIDGINILAQREKYYPDFLEIFKNLPFKYVKHFLDILEGLTRRTQKCVDLVEPFSYENVSRYSWRFRKGCPLNSLVQTGIPGTEYLGLNEFQKYWIALNIKEDHQEKYEEQYDLAIFLASFSDPKAAKKIRNMERSRKEQEEERRKRIIAKGSAEDLGGYWNPADTKEGIIAEIEKMRTGEKDEHDLAIEAYEKALKTKMFMQMKQMKEMKKSTLNDEERFYEETRAITAEEMAERIKKMQERKNNNPVIRYFDNGEDRTKYMDMSNVDDRTLIRETDFLDEEEYEELIKDEIFGGFQRPLKPEDKQVEENYLREQRRLASQYDEDMDFPHLRNK